MSKFKVGDIVVGTCEPGSPYDITYEGWKGVVIRVSSPDSDTMLVQDPTGELSRDGWIVEEKHFELVKREPTLEDKVDSLIKQVIALSKAVSKLYADQEKT